MVQTDGCPALGRNHYSKFSQTFPFQKENTNNQAGQTRGQKRTLVHSSSEIFAIKNSKKGWPPK
jgi:hypothetical protein